MSPESAVYMAAMMDIEISCVILVWNMSYHRQVIVTAISHEPRRPIYGCPM